MTLAFSTSYGAFRGPHGELVKRSRVFFGVSLQIDAVIISVQFSIFRLF